MNKENNLKNIPTECAGFIITDRIQIGDVDYAIGYNGGHPINPYVVWRVDADKKGFSVGHYFLYRDDAIKDIFDRATSYIPVVTPYVVPNSALEEACRQWCDFIDEVPERKTGEGYAEFTRIICEDYGGLRLLDKEALMLELRNKKYEEVIRECVEWFLHDKGRLAQRDIVMQDEDFLQFAFHEAMNVDFSEVRNAIYCRIEELLNEIFRNLWVEEVE